MKSLQNTTPSHLSTGTTTASICVLTHNEEKHIGNTLCSIINDAPPECIITVYANGCTDSTVKIVSDMIPRYPQLTIYDSTIASKSNTWNTAFNNCTSDVIIFSDADIEIEQGTIQALVSTLLSSEETIITSCRYSPRTNIRFSQKIVGFLQQPLAVDYLCGCFYAVHKSRLLARFTQLALKGMPSGIVGEDDFLTMIVGRNELRIINKKYFYTPPGINDFISLLARFRWQSEQLDMFYSQYVHKDKMKRNNGIARLMDKFTKKQNPTFLLLKLPAPAARMIFQWLFAQVISNRYKKFGPIVNDGCEILSKKSRTVSAK